MKWDVFISHSSHDVDFAAALAEALQTFGLRVWFDGFMLQPGDSLRRSIDQGLADSEYGVVILSPTFFAREWPKKELDGLIAREDGPRKVIIPVWHNTTVEDVRKFSPLLADRLSIVSTGSVIGVAEKVVRSIYKNRIDLYGWAPKYFTLPEGTELALLPLRPHEGYAIGIGRHPITNGQYSDFIRQTGHPVPIGERLVENEWRGPFVPLDEPSFNAPDKPVVCVDFSAALRYCHWATKKLNKRERDPFKWRRWVILPTIEWWDFAATGLKGATAQSLRRSIDDKICHRLSSPELVDSSSKRSNERGIADMFGNVWEWCTASSFDEDTAFVLAPRWSRTPNLELRGGGFLDDLTKIKPYLHVGMLMDGAATRHADIGFRIAALIKISDLPKDLRIELNLQENFPSYFSQPLGSFPETMAITYSSLYTHSAKQE